MLGIQYGRNKWVWMLVAALAGCGTRVGNPQQPTGQGGDTKPKPRGSKDIPSEDPNENPISTLNLIALPTVTVELSKSVVEAEPAPVEVTDSGAGASLTGSTIALVQGPLQRRTEEMIARQINHIPKRMAAALRSVNSLSQALNREKFAKEGSFAKKVGDLTVSGTIKKIGGDERGEYEGLFCVENVPFVHYRWVGSGSVVEVRRSMKLDPFIQKEDPDYGLDSRRHVRYTDGNVKEFEMSEHGAPSSDDDQGTVAETSHAVAKVNQAGSIEYHSVHSRRKDMQEPQTFIADAYSTGRYNQDGSGRVLLHDSKLRIFVPLCQTDFSAQNLATPGWCFEFTFGPNISDIKTRHSRIDASRILTGDLQAAGIGQVSDLKKVEVLGNHSTIEGCPPP